MNPFRYTSLAEQPRALDALSAEVRPLAGGTDLVPRLTLRMEHPEVLVDLKTGSLPKGVEATGDGWRIGTLTTLRTLEHHDGLRRSATALTQAAGDAATPQLRNRATIGGNLLQRPRCWYYRDPDVSCWLSGGEGCPARHGRNDHHAIFATDRPCVAVHPSDPAVALIALDADIVLRGPNGSRTVPLVELLHAPTPARRVEHGIGDAELLVGVELRTAEDRRSAYLLPGGGR